MISDVTLGQYFPGNSLLHRMDPRMKIVVALLYLVAVFLCRYVLSYFLILLITLLLVAVSRIPLRLILRALRPIVLILLFTTLLNLFWTSGEHMVFRWRIASWWTLTLYEEGLWRALFMMIRVVVLVVSASLFLTYTTSPIQLTDALESLLSPLRAIKVPVHEFAMMMTIALRFIPILLEETEKIMNAQKSRGSELSSGNFLKRARAMIPVIVPLFVSAFSRATELATAMECRCYRGGNGRTKLVQYTLHLRDFLMLSAVLLLFAGILLINRFAPGLIGWGYSL